MSHPIWPFFGLTVTTPRLVLRYVDDTLATELGLLAARGIHDPATMPFAIPWTDAPAEELPIGALRHFWHVRSENTPERVRLSFAVIARGEVVGFSALDADDFACVREFSTASWLGIAHQGRGLGGELRAATLHLGFEGLGAVRAESGAFADNERSNRVSRRLGYRENGRHWLQRRGEPAEQILYVLDRETWEASRRDDITIDGIEPVRTFIGLS